MSYSYDCDQDCPLTLTPVFGSEPARTYTLPEKTAGLGPRGWLLDDQSLLVFDFGYSTLWRLTGDGQGQLVGHTDPSGATTSIISTEAGDPVIYNALIDTSTGEITPLPITVEDTSDLWLNGFPNGLIVNYYHSDQDIAAWVLPTGSQTYGELPVDVDTSCDQLLADGSVICWSYTSGLVSRYEPASGTQTQLSDLPIYTLAFQN